MLSLGKHVLCLFNLQLFLLSLFVLDPVLLFLLVVLEKVLVVEPAPLECELDFRLLHFLQVFLLVEELEEVVAQAILETLKHALAGLQVFVGATHRRCLVACRLVAITLCFYCGEHLDAQRVRSLTTDREGKLLFKNGPIEANTCLLDLGRGCGLRRKELVLLRVRH